MSGQKAPAPFPPSEPNPSPPQPADPDPKPNQAPKPIHELARIIQEIGDKLYYEYFVPSSSSKTGR